MKSALLHILIVDDDNRLRSLIRRYLVDNGFIAVMAPDAAQARKILKTLKFDLIILDVMMPNETGVEFLKDLRKTSQIPVLMLTAQNESADRIAGLETGADDYLAKPFEPKELILRIKSILKRQPSPIMAEMPQGLTTAEEDLLNIFIKRPNQIITRSELAISLGNISERAVDVQVLRLRKKLDKNLHIQTIRGSGYKLNIS